MDPCRDMDIIRDELLKKDIETVAMMSEVECRFRNKWKEWPRMCLEE